jgi:hypothetical protein
MSGYVDLYQLKRAQAETGLTPEAKETMIIVLFDGEKRSDDNVTLKRFMKRNGLKVDQLNLLMQDCDNKIIQEDLVDRVKRTRLPKEEALQRMVNLSTPITVATRRKAAISLLIDPGAAEKKVEKKAKGKETQADKKAKKQAKREKNALAKAKRSGKPKAKGNKKKK